MKLLKFGLSGYWSSFIFCEQTNIQLLDMQLLNMQLLNMQLLNMQPLDISHEHVRQ